MAFVTVKCVGKDGSTWKSLVNLDKIENIMELPIIEKTIIDFGVSTISVENTIDEILETAFELK